MKFPIRNEELISCFGKENMKDHKIVYLLNLLLNEVELQYNTFLFARN